MTTWIDFAKDCVWPLVVVVGTVAFYKPVKGLMERVSRDATAVSIGKVKIEMSSGARVAQSIGHVSDNIPGQALIRIAKSSMGEHQPAAWNDEEVASFTLEEKERSLVPFLDACVDRLEYCSGIGQGTLRRYVVFESEVLSERITGGQLSLAGYLDDPKCILAAIILLDVDPWLGSGEMISRIGSFLGAIQLSLGTEQKWKLLVGIAGGRSDTVNRIIEAQHAFRPAILAERLAIIELTPSVGMGEALLRGVELVRAERVAKEL